MLMPPISKVVSQDGKMSSVMSSLLPNIPIKIALNGKSGVLMDEKDYEGLIETVLILQESPGIIQTLQERENGTFIYERDLHKYV